MLDLGRVMGPYQGFRIMGRREEVFSSNSANVDFVSLKGIQTRISVEKNDLLIIKDLIDNAPDIHETTQCTRLF
ncbi:MAG: hypothetical protein WAM14_10035 [Candidatus Nitrosopolaris sp.]